MITFYLLNNPAYIGQPQPFQVGLIDSTGALTDITDVCTVELIQPVGGIIVDTNNIVVNSIFQNITVYLKVTYSSYPEQFFSFCFVQPFEIVTQEQLYKTFVNYLPQNVYNTNIDLESPVYVDNTAITTTISQLYEVTAPILTDPDNPDYYPAQFEDLNTILNRFYPDSGYPAWEQYLVGTNSLYLQPDTEYANLLTLFYQTNVNNNNNPYFLAYNISQYIYYRTGIQYYVYIGEDVFDVNSAFILAYNELSKCILVGSNNDANPYQIVVYIIDGSSINAAFQHELNTFIRRLVRSSMLVVVDYSQSLSSLGLTIDLNDTYWQDPRQMNTYCIEYNPGELADALGYTSDNDSTRTIMSFTVTLSPPAPGNVLTLGQTYTVTITPTYSTPTTLPLPIIYYTQFFGSDQNVVNFYFTGGVEYFVANTTGTSIMNIYLGTILNTITYTVT